MKTITAKGNPRQLARAAERLAALGHESRLAIVRSLLAAEPPGLNAGAIAKQLRLVPATLSFHLAHLRRAGLVQATPHGRFIFYAADRDAVSELTAYLGAQCTVAVGATRRRASTRHGA